MWRVRPAVGTPAGARDAGPWNAARDVGGRPASHVPCGAARMTRPRRLLRWTTLSAVAVFALLFARAAMWRPLALSGAAPDDGFTRVQGVVHVHTTLSDGGGAPAEVIAAAQAVGLDFVVVTDHNHLEAKSSEGYHDRLLVGVGTEVSTTAGHVLALDLPQPTFRFWGDVSAALDDVRALGGVAFAAHPASARLDLRWSAWDEPGPWGVEVWNGDSQWRAAGWLSRLRVLALYRANPDAALARMLVAPTEELRSWDTLLARRDAPLVAGADAHSRITLGRDRGDDGGTPRERGSSKGRGLRFPSYEALFRLVRNQVLLDQPLTGDAGRDLHAIAQALARGRSYAVFDALAPGGGFSFTAERAGRRVSMGDTVAPAPGLRLRVGGRWPVGAEALLLRDGHEVARGGTGLAHDVTEAGVYRVEVRVPGWNMPWLLSNPIYVFGAPAAEARRLAAAWPTPEPAPAPTRIIDAFDDVTIFGAEFDPASSIAVPLVVPPEQAGALRAGAGRGVGRMAFLLGRPGPGGPPHPWCALVSRAARDWRGARGLSLAVRADGVYRFAVQVRDVNPRGSDGGFETWQTSVRTSTEWQRIALPFERFRSLDKHSDGRLDLDQVGTLVLVLDDLTLNPGTTGTIWFDDLGTY